jgi:hypothetical protein
MSRMAIVLRLAIPALGLVAIQFAAAAEPVRQQSARADAPESLLREYLQALDHLDMDAAKSIAKSAAEKSSGPITELMIRHARLLGAGKPETPAKTQARRESHNVRNNSYYTVTYNVADLVVRPQKIVLDQTPSSETKKQTASEPPDFDGLIDLITGTIKPETWEDVGQRGMIRAFPRNLSLIITQTQDVHKEIVELLEQLRRRMDVTVMLETRVAIVPGDVVPKDSRETITRDEWPNLIGLGPSGGQPTVLRATLDEQQLARLIDVAQKSGGTTPVRRVTTLNGQMVAMSFPIENGKTHQAEIQAVVRDDRRRVGLTLVLDQNRLVHASSVDGKTLAIDLPPLDDKPTKGDQRSANTKASSTRRLLLVTPHVLIAEEEEERLGVELPVRK